MSTAPHLPRPSTIPALVLLLGSGLLLCCNSVAGLDDLSFGGVGGGGGNGGNGGNGGDPGWTCDQSPPPPGTPNCPNGCSCSSDTLCEIDCSGGAQACRGMVLTCPEGRDCVVDCDAAEACTLATIVCPDRYDCTINCDGGGSCTNADIQCSATGMCAVDCFGADSCANTTIECGSNTCAVDCGGTVDLTVECNQSCHCTNPCGA